MKARTMRTHAMSDEEMRFILERLGILDADSAFVARAVELSNVTLEGMTRLPDFVDKNIAPAQRFSVPLR